METAIINGICRCCASEGAFKDIRSAYQWMGAEEIYADMLKECFDLSLWSSGEGDDGGICEVCVTQLRNASNFKKQVLHTEEQFKKHLHTRLFKPSIVKVELPANDGIDSDDNISAEEGYSGTDYEVSAIKVESPEESKPKKRSAKMSTRASTSRAKKAKGDAGESSTKRKPGWEPKKVKEEKTDRKISIVHENTIKNTEKLSLVKISKTGKHYSNIQEILKCTNATPIRRGGVTYTCCYCEDGFAEPAALKEHSSTHENTLQACFMKSKSADYVVKLDITNLKCKLCNSDIDNLEQLMTHLKEVHKRSIFLDIPNQILPFKFGDPDSLKCFLCTKVYSKFKMLLEHMPVHYRNYICEICDAGFVTQHGIVNHKLSHKTGSFTCQYCPKVFKTLMNKRSHEKSVHVMSHLLHKCAYCAEKFCNSRAKYLHMAKMHGTKGTFKCKACDRTFTDEYMLGIHTKRDHLMERKHKCAQCDKTFFSRSEVVNHMVSHTGSREFKCSVCFKSYGRKKTLTEHMRIHNDDRRFKCEHCGQAFVQKCSWRGHMRSKHGEEV